MSDQSTIDDLENQVSELIGQAKELKEQIEELEKDIQKRIDALNEIEGIARDAQ